MTLNVNVRSNYSTVSDQLFNHLDHFYSECLASMLTETFSIRWLQIFFISGITPYNPFRSQRNRMRIIPLWNAFPSICYISSAYVAVYWALHDGTNGERFDFNYFSYMVFIAFKTFIVASVFQRTVFPRSNAHVWDHLLCLERLIRRQIQLNINLDRFRRRFLRKACCVFIVKFSLTTIEFIYPCDSTIRENFCVLLLAMQTRIVTMYVLFYIDMFNHIVYLMNRQMAYMPKVLWKPAPNPIFVETSISQANAIRRQLRTVKTIHFQLWKTVVFINEEFGYILVALTIHFTNARELFSLFFIHYFGYIGRMLEYINAVASTNLIIYQCGFVKCSTISQSSE